jgi:intraflagellar transport protein 81
MAQLEEERGQLVEKVAGLRKKTAEIRGFAPLLEATSSLRKEQEEEGKLRERMGDQRMNLQAAERRYADANRRLAETRMASREDLTAEAVFDAAPRDNAELRNLVRKALPQTLEARRETLQRLGRMLAAPAKSEHELHELRNNAAQLEHVVQALTAEVTAAQRAAGDDKLAMFRQQAALMAKKLAQKEEALDAANREVEALGRELEAKESKLSELSGPKFMRRDEFKAYAAALRTKTGTFKALKQELADLRQESVVLAHTEALLRGRAGDTDAFLRRLEEKKGVAGYTGVQSDLEKVSALKARIDESKGATLNEISRIVEDINRAIKEKKAKLAPAIQALRVMRQEFSDVEAAWLQDKARYESVASGLEAEKAQLEREADAAQAEAHGEDSRRAMLGAMAEAAQAQVERAREEAAYVAGEGRYLRDFRTLQDVYAHKLQQLEALAKELRKKQKDIRDNAAMHAAQRAKFVDLRRLLQAKIAIYRAAFDGGLNGEGKSDGFDLGASNVLLLAAAP